MRFTIRPLGLTAAVLMLATTIACTKSEAPAVEEVAGEWRQWRGTNAQGLSTEEGLPTRWAPEGSNVLWKTRMPGLSNSSPIVSGGRVFLTSAWGQRKFAKFGSQEALNRAIVAFDVETGDKLWEQVVFDKTGQERRHHLNTPAAVTPTADGERVYVYFGMGLAALDYDGNVLWKREVDPYYIERARYGVVSSPIVVGDAVVVVRDDEWGGDQVQDISWLAAYDKRTGEPLWRSENDETCCSYAPPIVRETAAGPELIFPSTPFIAGYDPASGDRIWTIDHTLRQVVPTVLLSDDLLILPGSVHMRSIAVYRLTGSGTATQSETLWGASRSSPKIPSPVLVDGNLVVLTDNGLLIAMDAVTGEKSWQQRLGGNFRSSLVAGDGKIYATSDRCETSVVDFQGKTLAKNQLEGNCEATLAIADGRIYIRTANELYAIAKSESDEDKKTERRERRRRKKQEAAAEATPEA